MPRKANLAEIKSFIVAQRWGMLSTVSHSQQGYPFGSLVPYDIDSHGNVYIYISLIAEHYKNLKSDPRASILVLDSFGITDPQAHARATVLLDFQTVSETERDAVQKDYEARFPNSINYEIAHNFLFMKGSPIGVRWIGGFGDIQWIEKKDFIETQPDILAYDSWEAISHMNQDHQDALHDFVRAQAQTQSPIHHPRMVSLDSRGFRIRYGKNSESEVQISFASPLSDPEQVRQAVIESLKIARGKKA